MATNPILERINEVFENPSISGLAEAVTLLAELVAQLEASIGDFEGDIQAVADDLAAHILAASGELSSHAADTSTHGVTKIVGEVEDQDLDNKDIGKSNPGYGRFSPLLVSQRIDAGETVQVPIDNGLIAVDVLDVVGELNVDGSVVVV